MSQSSCKIYNRRLHLQKTRLILASSTRVRVNTWRPTLQEHLRSLKISIFETRTVSWSSIANVSPRCQHGRNSYKKPLRPPCLGIIPTKTPIMRESMDRNRCIICRLFSHLRHQMRRDSGDRSVHTQRRPCLNSATLRLLP
jgi:hypothetical protein